MLAWKKWQLPSFILWKGRPSQACPPGLLPCNRGSPLSPVLRGGVRVNVICTNDAHDSQTQSTPAPQSCSNDWPPFQYPFPETSHSKTIFWTFFFNPTGQLQNNPQAGLFIFLANVSSLSFWVTVWLVQSNPRSESQEWVFLKSSDPIINPELLLLPTATTQWSLNLCLNTSSDGELIISWGRSHQAVTLGARWDSGLMLA